MSNPRFTISIGLDENRSITAQIHEQLSAFNRSHTGDGFYRSYVRCYLKKKLGDA